METKRRIIEWQMRNYSSTIANTKDILLKQLFSISSLIKGEEKLLSEFNDFFTQNERIRLRKKIKKLKEEETLLKTQIKLIEAKKQRNKRVTFFVNPKMDPKTGKYVDCGPQEGDTREGDKREGDDDNLSKEEIFDQIYKNSINKIEEVYGTKKKCRKRSHSFSGKDRKFTEIVNAEKKRPRSNSCSKISK